LFAAVQKILEAKAKPQKKRGSQDFPFRSLFQCGECGGMFTAQFAKGNGGIYRYYRCTKKRGLCSQSYVQEADLADQLRQRLQTMSLCDRYTDHMLGVISEWEKEEISVSHSDVQNLSLKIKASDKRMEKLVGAYLDGDIPKDIYLNQKDSIMRATLTLKDRMKAFEQRRNTWVEPLREWVLDLQQATFLYESDNLSEIASFVQKIGTNHTVRDKTAHFATPSPFGLVAQRLACLPFSSFSSSRAAATRSLSEDEVLVCAPQWS